MMRSLSSITRNQWIVIIGLELAAVVLYLGVIPWLALSMGVDSSPTTDLAADLPAGGTPVASTKPTIRFTPTIRPATPSAKSNHTPIPAETNTPTVAATLPPIPTDTPTQLPAKGKLESGAFVKLELNPRAALARQTIFFTSVCFGQDANPLQDRDFMAPADWSSSPGRKCIFGYKANPTDGLPTGRYSVSGGSDGQPRFYLVPPEAFAEDPKDIKTLSLLHIIVDPDQGCGSIGSIGITADGLSYQSPACEFLRAGGVIPASDGSKSLVLPANLNNILDPSSTGGAYGFQAFPVVIFRKGFSLYFTGRSGYAPPRTWFESDVDTIEPKVDIKTTAEMTDQEVKTIAREFDRILGAADPKSQLASIEREAPATSASPVKVKSKQSGTIDFATTPGTVLSSVSWRITPQNNVDKNQFLESNLCMDVNGVESCFTGVEDFAHCAFFTPCVTGFSRLDSIEHGGYVATRYFPPGSAPIIRDRRVVVKFQAPDTGVVLEVDVKVRVRDVDSSLTKP